MTLTKEQLIILSCKGREEGREKWWKRAWVVLWEISINQCLTKWTAVELPGLSWAPVTPFMIAVLDKHRQGGPGEQKRSGSLYMVTQTLSEPPSASQNGGWHANSAQPDPGVGLVSWHRCFITDVLIQLFSGLRPPIQWKWRQKQTLWPQNLLLLFVCGLGSSEASIGFSLIALSCSSWQEALMQLSMPANGRPLLRATPDTISCVLAACY